MCVLPSARTPMRTPAMKISPLSGSSSQLMQRRSVDLPEPEGPSTLTVWPCATFRQTSRSTSLPAKLFETLRTSTANGGALVSKAFFLRGETDPRHQRLDQHARQPVQPDGHDEGLERDEVLGLHGARGRGQFAHRDDRQESGILQANDKLVAEHRRRAQ